jgi:hypothetical protein
MVFSDTVNNLGILQQARLMGRVEATQWPTYKVVNSCNNWLDYLISYGVANDKFLQLDDTNHTTLSESVDDLTINVSDYSFSADQQGNAITTLLGVSVLVGGYYQPLTPVDRSQVDTATFGMVSGTPTQYDKISDTIIRLDRLPPATVTNGLKYYFQRAGSYFVATDTTKQPGVNPALHRGFVIASVYDMGLNGIGTVNMSVMQNERQLEINKMIEYFATRNNDQPKRMTGNYQNNR